jgi:tetratricopeptide (TPR) repeat protein
MNANSIPARLGRGGIYLAKSEEIAAVNDFEVVVDEDKNNFQGYMGLGQARFRQGYYDKAVKHFKSARGADPANPVAYQYLMLSYLADNDIKNVKKTFSKFKEIASPEDMDRFRNDPTYTAVVRIVD